VILLRHTRPAVADGVCYGRTDLALAASFEDELVVVLAGLPPVARVLTSPLGRCRRLAAAIADARGLPLSVDPRLAEMDFGAWEGRQWSALPRAELDAWAADFHGARPHGGESVAMLAARVAAALADAPPGPPPALWVAHAGVARAAAALAGRADGWDTRLGFGRWLDLAAPAGAPPPP
jgi:alpha-ribazole phosphatase